MSKTRAEIEASVKRILATGEPPQELGCYVISTPEEAEAFFTYWEKDAADENKAKAR
jgi:hypothetical protein